MMVDLTEHVALAVAAGQTRRRCPCPECVIEARNANARRRGVIERRETGWRFWCYVCDHDADLDEDGREVEPDDWSGLRYVEGEGWTSRGADA